MRRAVPLLLLPIFLLLSDNSKMPLNPLRNRRKFQPKILHNSSGKNQRQEQRGTAPAGANQAVFNRSINAIAPAGARTLAPLMKKTKVSRGVFAGGV